MLPNNLNCISQCMYSIRALFIKTYVHSLNERISIVRDIPTIFPIKCQSQIMARTNSQSDKKLEITRN